MNEYVFISYKFEQKNIALELKSILEENGIACWMAPESIPGGSNYSAEIFQAISQCKVFVVILSSLSQDSKHVLKEIDIAINSDKKVLPFAIEKFSFNDSIAYYFTNIQLFEAYLSWEASLERIIREIRYEFESIDVHRSPDTILRDPVKIGYSLPHTLCKNYLLFGRYQIDEFLGIYWGYQHHYSALDQHTKKQMLVKYIDRTLPYKEFGFGISTAGALFQHPYLATPVDEYSNESFFIHIEPFYQVESLDSLVRRSGPQTPREVVKWAIAVCYAMIYLNEEMGYTYCYMLPQNIRIQQNGIPILFDLSVALPINSPRRYFMDQRICPPECNSPPFFAQPTIDIYSLGTNIFFALTGRMYYTFFDYSDKDAFLECNNIPDGFMVILQRCLQVNPQDRYQNFREVLYDLEHIDQLKPNKKKSSILRKLFAHNQ